MCLMLLCVKGCCTPAGFSLVGEGGMPLSEAVGNFASFTFVHSGRRHGLLFQRALVLNVVVKNQDGRLTSC
ncbi:hypothetical protein AG1IA_02490 [Rhizoctonia solani AG-1 IA]|uniref:Secreted protein n=1 Tax=Thanatephorus cucumeris (strain AG1-IA) TaxID=983506 RepID=L8X380_THACA|nr:hypothetical protein AG1IA_02490 [Rhizoctonia solani AG-1 IA]